MKTGIFTLAARLTSNFPPPVWAPAAFTLGHVIRTSSHSPAQPLHHYLQLLFLLSDLISSSSFSCTRPFSSVRPALCPSSAPHGCCCCCCHDKLPATSSLWGLMQFLSSPKKKALIYCVSQIGGFIYLHIAFFPLFVLLPSVIFPLPVPAISHCRGKK